MLLYSVAFSNDGKTLASGGADGIVKLWDVAARKESKVFKPPTNEKGNPAPPPGGVTGVVFTPDGKRLVSIQDRFVRLWDVTTGNQIKAMGPTLDDLYGLAVSRNGNLLATSGYAGYVTLWDLAAGKQRVSHKLKAFGAYCIAFTPDGKSVVTGHDNHHCYVSPVSAP
jgi:WD40 repeat protein